MPPLSSASRIASCSACIVCALSSSGSHGFWKPLDSSKSESCETRSPRSMPSNSSGSYLRYLYFNFCLLPSLVVVLLPSARRHVLIVEDLYGALGRALAARLGGRELAAFGTADALERAEAFEHEVDRGGAMRRSRLLLAGACAGLRRGFREPL